MGCRSSKDDTNEPEVRPPRAAGTRPGKAAGGSFTGAARLNLDLPALVCDNGSGAIKAGPAAWEAPRVFPSIMGTPSGDVQHGLGMMMADALYIGDAAQKRRGLLAISSPFADGRVDDWDAMGTLWDHVFAEELGIDLEGRRVVVTEAAGDRMANREMFPEVFFERYLAGAMHLATPAALALHRYGKHTGVVLDAGESRTQAVPIYHGHVVQHGVADAAYGGRDVVLRMQTLLEHAHAQWRAAVGNRSDDLAREVVHAHGTAALDYADTMSRTASDDNDALFRMPDGTVVRVGDERYQCAEQLFAPKDGRPAVQDLVAHALRGCAWGNETEVFLTGGATKLRGYGARLERELRGGGDNVDADGVRVRAPNDRDLAAWAGGAMVAASAATTWLTKERYDEYGASVLHHVFPSW